MIRRVLLVVLLITGSDISATPVFPKGVIENWENSNGSCAALLVDVTRKRAASVYNGPLAFQEALPIGSLMKPLSAVIFLRSPSIYRLQPVHCKGRFYPESIAAEDRYILNIPNDSSGNPYLRCALRDGHGTVMLTDAIARSCNVYFLTHAARAPYAFHSDLVAFWKLEKKSGLSGIYREAFPVIQNPSSLLQATTAAIGEGSTIRLTMVKIAAIYSDIFSTGNATYRITPHHREQIRRGLQQVVERGTLRTLRVDRKDVAILAGKTGTATIRGRRYATHGWNVIYFTMNRQPLLLVTFVNEGSGGGEALSLSRTILNAL